MTPDRAAELLQIPERGIELLKRFEAEEVIQRAVSAVQQGFTPADVAEMYGLEYEPPDPEDEMPEGHVPEGQIHVYECTTRRCRQKGRVATSSVGPDDDWENPEFPGRPPTCPSCHDLMHFVMSVEDEMDITHLKRTYLPKARVHDDMHGVDKSGNRSGAGGDEDDE